MRLVCLLALLWLSTPAASPGAEPDAVFYELARRDVASGILATTIAERVDVGVLEQKLQLQGYPPKQFTASDQKHFHRAVDGMIRCMLVELAPKGYLERQAAEYYASALSRADAAVIIDAYDQLSERPEGRQLQIIREKFWEDRLSELLSTARTWSKSFRIPSATMAPNLLPGDNVVFNLAAYREAPPQRGDVIVFRYPDDETKLFVKRIIGLPGEVVEVRDQMVYLNDHLLSEDYVQHTDHTILADNPRDQLKPVTVRADSYFVLGDNRESSLDSRFWGFVSRDKVLGKAALIYLSVDPVSKIVRWDRSGTPVH